MNKLLLLGLGVFITGGIIYEILDYNKSKKEYDEIFEKSKKELNEILERMERHSGYKPQIKRIK